MTKDDHKYKIPECKRGNEIEHCNEEGGCRTCQNCTRGECPKCGRLSVFPSIYPETGEEFVCDCCGWTSLDAPLKDDKDSMGLRMGELERQVSQLMRIVDLHQKRIEEIWTEQQRRVLG